MESGSSTYTSARLWRSVDPDQLLWNGWDDEHVVYHRPSGRTHFLNAASAALVQYFLVEPRSTQAVAMSFPPPDGPADSPEHHEEIALLLARLEHLGMIERI